MAARGKDVIRIDVGDTVRTVIAAMSGAPEAVTRARHRARNQIERYVRREVMRETAKITGASQKTLLAMSRVRFDRLGPTALSVWVGTDPIKIHNLGIVSWTRRTPKGRLTKGARVGRRTYPGTWSWGEGSKTGMAVMRRTGSSRLPIEVVDVEVHDLVSARLNKVADQISEQYQKFLLHELNYEINVKGTQ